MRSIKWFLLASAFGLLVPMSHRGPMMARADDCEGDCPEEIYCTWADPPMVRGQVLVGGSLTNGILVQVKNKTQNLVYQPYGPDSQNCEPDLPIPETQSHYCPYCQRDGQWTSFWETWCYGVMSPPPQPTRAICEGDSILARAIYQGHTVTVRAQYDGESPFWMPDIEF
jgi:hypothetical protein